MDVKKVFFIAALSLCISCQPSKQEGGIIQEKEALFPEILDKAINEKNEESKYSISLKYPQFDGENWMGLNKILEDNAAEVKGTFLVFIKDFEPVGNRVLRGKYKIEKLGDDYVSIAQKSEMAVPGTSRIIKENSVVNWDWKKNEPFSPSKVLFKDGWYEYMLKTLSNKIPEGCQLDDVGFDKNNLFILSPHFMIYGMLVTGGPECYDYPLLVDWIEMDLYLTDEGRAMITRN